MISAPSPDREIEPRERDHPLKQKEHEMRAFYETGPIGPETARTIREIEGGDTAQGDTLAADQALEITGEFADGHWRYGFVQAEAPVDEHQRVIDGLREVWASRPGEEH